MFDYRVATLNDLEKIWDKDIAKHKGEEYCKGKAIAI